MLNRSRQKGAVVLVALASTLVMGVLAGTIVHQITIHWDIVKILKSSVNRPELMSEIGDSALTYQDTDEKAELTAWFDVREVLDHGLKNGNTPISLGSQAGHEIEGVYKGVVGVSAGCFDMDITLFSCHLIEVVTTGSGKENRQGFLFPARKHNTL